MHFTWKCPHTGQEDDLYSKNFPEIPFAQEVLMSSEGRKTVNFKLKCPYGDEDPRAAFYAVMTSADKKEIVSDDFEIQQQIIANIISKSTYNGELIDKEDVIKDLRRRAVEDITKKSFYGGVISDKSLIAGAGYIEDSTGRRIGTFDRIKVNEIESENNTVIEILECYTTENLESIADGNGKFMISFGTDKDHVFTATVSLSGEYNFNIMQESIKLNMGKADFKVETEWPMFENLSFDVSNDLAREAFASSRCKIIVGDADDIAEKTAEAAFADMFSDL